MKTQFEIKNIEFTYDEYTITFTFHTDENTSGKAYLQMPQTCDSQHLIYLDGICIHDDSGTEITSDDNNKVDDIIDQLTRFYDALFKNDDCGRATIASGDYVYHVDTFGDNENYNVAFMKDDIAVLFCDSDIYGTEFYKLYDESEGGYSNKKIDVNALIKSAKKSFFDDLSNSLIEKMQTYYDNSVVNNKCVDDVESMSKVFTNTLHDLLQAEFNHQYESVEIAMEFYNDFSHDIKSSFEHKVLN